MSNEGTAYNRAYLASAIAFAKNPLRETSDTLETLSEIARSLYESVYKAFKHFKQ